MSKSSSTLRDKIKQSGIKLQKPKAEPVWDGPCDEGEKGGITQSMLSLFMACRERARLRWMEGITTIDSFSHRMEYGSMWHACEESLAKGGPRNQLWVPLTKYCQKLCKKYPTQQQQIVHWHNVCKVQFPIYVDYWKKHPDVKDRTPLLQEQVFHVPYKLPSERTVWLRGKFDSVDLIGKSKAIGVWLQENKSKGDIKEEQMKRQLGFDLQTGMYMVALKLAIEDYQKNGLNGFNRLPEADWMMKTLKGFRYNVIRRPLSGGKGSISQKKPSKSNITGETDEEFYQRLGEVIQEEASAAIKEKRDCFFFYRWKVEVSSADLLRFEREFLIPCLEQLCDWHEWVSSGDPWREGNKLHHRTPYGIYSPLAEGKSTDVDQYLDTGSEIGLTRGSPLFEELQ